MINIKFYGLIREQLKIKEMQSEAHNLNELFLEISEKTGLMTAKELKKSIIFIDKKPLTEFGGFRTKLNQDCEIALLSPASGG